MDVGSAIQAAIAVKQQQQAVQPLPAVPTGALSGLDLQQLRSTLHPPGQSSHAQPKSSRTFGEVQLLNGFDARRDVVQDYVLPNDSQDQSEVSEIKASIRAATGLDLTPHTQFTGASEGRGFDNLWYHQKRTQPHSGPSLRGGVPGLRTHGETAVEYSEPINRNTMEVRNGLENMETHARIMKAHSLQFLNQKHTRRISETDESYLIRTDPWGVDFKCMKVPNHPLHAKILNWVQDLEALADNDREVFQFDPLHEGEFPTPTWKETARSLVGGKGGRNLDRGMYHFVKACLSFSLTHPSVEEIPTYGDRFYEDLWAMWHAGYHGFVGRSQPRNSRVLLA